MSREQNRDANEGGTGGKEDYEVGQGGTAKDSSKNKVDGSGRRKQTRIKQGMREGRAHGRAGTGLRHLT